jgi:aminoacrylate hydrolase
LTFYIADSELAPYFLKEGQAAIVEARIDALLAFDGTPLVGKIAVETLVLGAQNDRVVPATRQTALSEALLKSELKMFPNGGHFFPNTHPQRFVDCVRDWLAETYS